MPHLWERDNRSFPTEAGFLQGRAKYLVVLSEENRVPVPPLWERDDRSFQTRAGFLQGGAKD